MKEVKVITDDVDGNLNLGTNTNTSPNLGDIWRDSNNVIKAVTEEGDAHDLWVGLGQVNGTDSHTAMTDADSLTINKFYRTGSTWTGSPIDGTSGNNQGFLLTSTSILFRYRNKQLCAVRNNISSK